MSLLGLLACVGDDPSLAGSDAQDAGSPACASHTGSFVVTYEERFGTCGELRTIAGSNEMTETYGDRPSPPCTGVFRTSSDQCTTTVETSCPSVAPDTTYTLRGTLRWNAQGSEASGDLEVSTSKCQSTYHAKVRRR